MMSRVILDSIEFQLTLDRLSHQLIENHGDFTDTAIIGVQPKGIHLANRIYERLKEIQPGMKALFGHLDPTFYRDDFRRRGKPIAPATTSINFEIEDKRVVLIDDVFYTGRTIRAAMDALLDYGRPSQVELMVLVNRRFSRQLPIQADYIGRTVDAVASEKVRVEWRQINGEDRIWVIPQQPEQA